MTPSAPACETASGSSALDDAQLIPAWMIGCRMPSSLVMRVEKVIAECMLTDRIGLSAYTDRQGEGQPRYIHLPRAGSYPSPIL